MNEVSYYTFLGGHTSIGYSKDTMVGFKKSFKK
jgi:hypothetical protein